MNSPKMKNYDVSPTFLESETISSGNPPDVSVVVTRTQCTHECVPNYCSILTSGGNINFHSQVLSMKIFMLRNGSDC